MTEQFTHTSLLISPPRGRYIVPVSMSEREIPERIRWLREEFGGQELEKGFLEFSRAWRSAGPQQRHHQLLTSHPWFFGLRVLEEAGNSLKGITEPLHFLAIERIAQDAKKLQALQDVSNLDVKEMRARLCCPRNGAPAVCEIESAFHFYRMGGAIEWISSQEEHPEFNVQLPDVSWSFAVECKRLDADAGKTMKRAHFYHLADCIAEELPPNRFAGHFHLTVRSALPSSTEGLRRTGHQIATALKSRKSSFEVDGLAVSANVYERGGIVIPPTSLEKLTREYSRPGSLRAVWVGSDEHSAPLIFTASTGRTNRIIEKITKEFKQARSQLRAGAGVVNIFLENAGPGDMVKLKHEQAFNLINTKLLESEQSKDILALCYLAGPFDQNYVGANQLAHEALQYRNATNPRSSMLSFINDG